MVYKVYLDGENVDSEFGQSVTTTKTFIGTYGGALKMADEFLKLIDFGSVTVFESGLRERKPVYVAVRDFNNIDKKELN